MHPHQQKHVIVTCYDDRINPVVQGEIEKIRAAGGQLSDKDVFRPPGGIHLLAGKREYRQAFYELLGSLREIAGTSVFHLWPHTNCRYCGIKFQEKLGTGSHSDLRFHLVSAEKVSEGVERHFAGSAGQGLRFDTRVILTIDQRIVTTREGHELLPQVPHDAHHGTPCLVAVDQDSPPQ